MLTLKMPQKTRVYQPRNETEMENVVGGKRENRHLLVCLG